MNKAAAANVAQQARRASAARKRAEKIRETCTHPSTTEQYGLDWCDTCGAQVEGSR